MEKYILIYQSHNSQMKIIFLFFFFVFSFSCSNNKKQIGLHTNTYRLNDCEAYLDTITENSSIKRSDLYYLEKDYKFDFTILKTIGLKIDTSKISTEGIYICKREYFTGTGQHEGFFFYRFFDNGKVYKSCTYVKIPENKEASKLDYGKFSEYMIKNNELIVETENQGEGMFSYYEILDTKFSLTGVSENKFDDNLIIHKTLLLEKDFEFYKIEFEK